MQLNSQQARNHSTTDKLSRGVRVPFWMFGASASTGSSSPKDGALGSGLPPNLVITKAHVLEVFHVRLLDGEEGNC